MTNQPSTIGEYFKSLTILHISLMSGLALMAAMMYFMFSDVNEFSNDSFDDTLYLLLVAALGVGGIIGGRWLGNTRLQAARAEENLAEKLNSYRSTLILRWALLEGPALMGVLFYMTFGNIVFLAVAAGLLIFLFMARPSKEKLIDDLELSVADRAKIENPATVL